MRENLKPYTGPDRLNYLCIFAMNVLGVRTLREMPVILSGYQSVSATIGGDEFHRLAHYLRLAGFLPTTANSLLLAIQQYRDKDRANRSQASATSFPKRFIILDDLSFTPTWTDAEPEDITQAYRAMRLPLPVRQQTEKPVHNVDKTASIFRGDKLYSGTVSPLGFVPPEMPSYPTPVPQPPGFVSWDELVTEADDFDLKDVEAGRQDPGGHNWRYRLYTSTGEAKVQLKVRSAGGLIDADGIMLDGVKHLIGLPGAGKTTLLTLLAAVIAKRELRACFLFPSIEVASGFVETLDQYKVSVGLLYGQSEGARGRQVMNFASAVGAGTGGFGVTRSTAPRFGTNCALAAWATDDDIPFPHTSPPCTELRQSHGKSKQDKLHRCALGSVCGRQHNERELTKASIWAGHVLSLDRRVSPLYTELDTRHFEYLANHMDLVVVDECDNAQASLDERGTSVMRLVSAESALTTELLQSIIVRVSRGDNAFLMIDKMGTMIEMIGRFISSNNTLVKIVQDMKTDIRTMLQDQMLTSLTILAEMHPGPDGDDEEAFQAYRKRQAGVERLWDVVAKRVAYRNDAFGFGIDGEEEEDGDGEENESADTVLGRISESLGITPIQTELLIKNLHAALDEWSQSRTEVTLKRLVDAYSAIPATETKLLPDQFAEAVTLLSGVTLVVLQFFGLAPFMRLLTAHGLLDDGVFESRPSIDLLRVLPESLMGRLGGLRYNISNEGHVQLQHVSLAGVPRLLPIRLNQIAALDGTAAPAVLLTSATSMLEDSPSFNVDVGPHYLLKRPKAGKGWENSRYAFTPISDPNDNAVKVRFSGAKWSRRDAAIRFMVDGLLKGGEFSPVSAALADNDIVHEVGRKVAFVVNSYEQCEMIARHIFSAHSERGDRIRYLVRPGRGTNDPRAVTAAAVESIGMDPNWDLLIFPMGAIGRGVNIVYQFGPRKGDAMVGSMFFLTRPHPRGDSLQLLQGLAARESARFDQRMVKAGAGVGTAMADYAVARAAARRLIFRLLRLPLQAARLGDLARPFVADQMVTILQTIGRAMRNDCPAFVYFVDSAWAPRSAMGKKDSHRTSMLVMMQTILKDLLASEDPSTRGFYESLYAPFNRPLSEIEGLAP